MQDFSDRGRRRRKRGSYNRYYDTGEREPRMYQERDRDPRLYHDRDHDAVSPGAPSNRPPIILAKPGLGERPSSRSSMEPPDLEPARPPPSAIATSGIDKPVLMLKSREESRPSSASSGVQSIPAMLAGEGLPHPGSHRHMATGTGAGDSGPYNRLAALPEMPHSMSLVDETFTWCDNGMEVLLDQTDFFTIGVLGSQGSGKSTLLSMLAGNSPQDSARSYAFLPQSKDKCGVCSHQTSGINLMVTPERVVLLDTQAILSTSVLNSMICNDKKYPPEYNTAENCVEMQSLQLASFLMTVCNVVLVVMDWFADPDLLRFIQTAEMLKPPTPPPSHENASPEDHLEYYPHLVFVLNKAEREDYSVENYNAMQATLSKLFDQSKLQYRGTVGMSRGGLLPGLNSRTVQDDVNLFLLPHMETQAANIESGGVMSLLPEYQGHPGYETLLLGLRNQLFALPRQLITHTVLSEKNWFHYAARTWEGVKKSTLFSEYNRLLV